MAPALPEIETHNDVVVLRPLGDVDFESADALLETALAHVDREALGLVLDLSTAGYVDSAGIRTLFEIADRLATHRQRLVLVVPAGALVRPTLRIVDVNRHATVHETLEDALADLHG